MNKHAQFDSVEDYKQIQMLFSKGKMPFYWVFPFFFGACFL
ncbi:hypothetical protein D932_02645 [Enterococcus casseliflavus 14-MB-W-14]|nr:hypothetical protein D932_02645 [Enterococcus casseliflavus 14-MB-W-14]